MNSCWIRQAQKRRQAVRALAAKAGKPFGFAFEGADAFTEGRSPVECPYVLESPEWKAWMAGWTSKFDRKFR